MGGGLEMPTVMLAMVGDSNKTEIEDANTLRDCPP